MVEPFQKHEQIGWHVWGLAEDPTQDQPQPATAGGKKYRYSDLASDTSFAEATTTFTDGGCIRQWHPKLNRASWAVVASDADGNHAAASLGPVWATLPQTSQAGEICGLAAARQLARGVAKKVITDCITVVKAVTSMGQWKYKCKFYSGVLRESELEKGSSLLTSVEHVRSHQADGEHLPDLPEDELHAIIGNKAADEAATEGQYLHPPFDEKILAKAKRSYLMAKNILLLAARALPEWSACKQGGKKELREEILVQRSRNKHRRADLRQNASPSLLTADGGHFWIPFGSNGHRCAFCTAKAYNQKQKDSKSTEVCERDLGQLGAVIAKAPYTHHRLHWSIHQKLGIRVLSCSRCDAYATIAPKHLLDPCIAKVRKPNWERLSKGKFPTSRFGNTACLCKPIPADVPKIPAGHVNSATSCPGASGSLPASQGRKNTAGTESQGERRVKEHQTSTESSAEAGPNSSAAAGR